MNEQFDLSIVIPAYTEEKRIGATLDKLAEYLRQHNFGRVEVIVAHARPPQDDKTLEIAREKVTLFDHLEPLDLGPKKEGEGKGSHVKRAVLGAKGQYILFMDADLATPLNYIETAYNEAKAGEKVLICSRDVTSSHKGIRKLISWGGNILVQTVLLPGVRDTQCGFKMFEREAANKLFSKQTIIGWTFDMEILALAKKYGYKIKQIEVNDWKDVAGGTFTPSTGAAVASLKDLFRIKWNIISRKYDQKP